MALLSEYLMAILDKHKVQTNASNKIIAYPLGAAIPKGCSNMCSGFCVGTCASGCAGRCGDNCTNKCSANCANGCSGIVKNIFN